MSDKRAPRNDDQISDSADHRITRAPARKADERSRRVEAGRTERDLPSMALASTSSAMEIGARITTARRAT